jgi:hypothetical protein
MVGMGWQVMVIECLEVMMPGGRIVDADKYSLIR